MGARSRGREDRTYREPFVKGDETPIISHENEDGPENENLSPDENSDNLLKDEEKQRILYDLFCGDEGKIDSSFLYKGKGAELYEKISTDESYPFIEIEKECLEELGNDRNFQEKVLKKIDYITDVGSGDGQKAIAFLGPSKKRWHEGVRWHGTYILEDYSDKMLEIARENIEKNAKNINLGSSQILRNGKHLTAALSNNMYLFLGGTIGNMSDEQIINELTNMDNNGIISGNKILLSYFTAPKTPEEIRKLINIYNSDSNKAFHENGMDMLGLSKDDFEFDTIYELENGTKLKLENGELKPYEGTFNNSLKGPFPGRIKGIIRAKRDCVVNIGNRKKEISKGQEFTLHYSRRFTKEGIEKLFKRSGCKVVYSIEKNGDSIVLLKKKPQKLGEMARDLGELISCYRDKILIVLTLGGMITGGFIKENNDNILERENERKIADTQWEFSQQSSNTGSTYYMQETNELIGALQLDNLDNEEYEKIIIDLFNIYVGNHIGEGVTTMDLIQGFWTEYGGMLIQRFGLNHYPYDFLTKDLVENTETFGGDVSCEVTKGKIFDRLYINDSRKISYETNKFNLFEYKDKDTGETYAIYEVNIHIGNEDMPIYMAAQKHCLLPVYSIEMVNEIQDRSGLNEKILENTKKLGEDFIVSLQTETHSITISSEPKDSIDIHSFKRKVNTVFLQNGKVFYVMTLKTISGKTIGLASDSPNGKFTTTMFLEMYEMFDSERSSL